MKLKNISLPGLAFLQATALVVYISAVTSLMQYIGDNVPQEDTALSSMTFLLMFVVSAVVSGVIVLGRAGQLYAAKQVKPAFQLVGWTILWAMVYFALFVAYLVSS